MRWNCPHCRVALTVPEDKLNTGWSYAKCYNCSGFAMVRRTDKQESLTGSKPEIRQAVVRKKIPSPPTFSLSSSDRTVDRIPEPVLQARILEKPQAMPPKFKAPAAIQIPTQTHLAPARNTMMPVALGLAGIMAISSGVYLYIQGQQIWEKAQAAPAKPAVEVVVSQSSPPTPSKQIRTVSAEVTDQLHQKAMAPTRPASAEPMGNALPSFVVQVREINATLRTGPGIQNSVVGIAKPRAELRVIDWQDRWFKVQIQNDDSQNYAWIRNDLVTAKKEMRTEDSNLSL